MKHQYKISDEFLNKIISVAYGDAKLSEKISIFFAARKNRLIKDLLNDYRLTAKNVKSIKNEKCPDSVIQKVFKDTGIRGNNLNSAWLNSFKFLFNKPIFSTTTAAILIAAIVVSIILFRQPSVPPAYSNAQVKTAQKQVKKSLAMVGKVFERTEFTLDNQILLKKVAPPIYQSFTIINDLFKGD